MLSYIVYEKKDASGNKHLYGHWGSGVPSDSDVQVVYKDETNTTLTDLTWSDIYLDYKKGCIKRKSDGKEVNVYVVDESSVEHLVAGEIPTTTRTLTGLSLTGITDPQNTGATLDISGAAVTATYSDSTTATIPSGSYTVTSPTLPYTIGAESDLDIIVSYTEGGVTKTATQTIGIIL